jgi:outer membrane protein assembly factor BamE
VLTSGGMMPFSYWKWKCYPMRILLVSLTLALISACGFPGVYKINIEQGNIVTQEMVDQLKPGMSRRQVKFIMGTPLVKDTFNRNRWDYVFMIRNGSTVLDQSRLAVEFNEDTLVNVFGDFVAADWAATGGAPTPTPPGSEPASELSTYQ